jgi:predicted dehydrogenase
VVQMKAANGAGVALFGTFSAQAAPPRLVDMLDIVGTLGRIRLDGPVLTFDGCNSARLEYDLQKEYAASYAAAIGHFVDCVRTGAPFETDAADNLQTLKLVEDCYRLAAA